MSAPSAWILGASIFGHLFFAVVFAKTFTTANDKKKQTNISITYPAIFRLLVFVCVCCIVDLHTSFYVYYYIVIQGLNKNTRY